jgi:hypothetical protein
MVRHILMALHSLQVSGHGACGIHAEVEHDLLQGTPRPDQESTCVSVYSSRRPSALSDSISKHKHACQSDILDCLYTACVYTIARSVAKVTISYNTNMRLIYRCIFAALQSWVPTLCQHKRSASFIAKCDEWCSCMRRSSESRPNFELRDLRKVAPSAGKVNSHAVHMPPD